VVAERTRNGELSAASAQAIIDSAAAIIASNPKLLIREQERLAALIVGSVADAVHGQADFPLNAPGLIELVSESLMVIAAHGRSVRGDESVEDLAIRMQAVIRAGLEKAEKEVGRSLDRGSVPAVVGALLRRWALDEVETLAIDDPRFEWVFDEVLRSVLARRFA